MALSTRDVTVVGRKVIRVACTGKRSWWSGVVPGLLLCLAPAWAPAQDTAWNGASLLTQDRAVHSEDLGDPSRPVIFRNDAPTLAFDLAGSETRKLEFQLAGPLNLRTVSESRWLNAGSGSLMAGGILEWTATDRLTLGTAMGREESRFQFQPLGSIHCQNGVLGADSYRASGCTFTNVPGASSRSILSVGAEYEVADSARAGVSLFRQEEGVGSLLPGSLGAASGRHPGLLGPSLPLQPVLPLAGGSAQRDFDSELSGIDLEFKLGISMDYAGDMQLGLQFTRVLDGQFSGMYPLADSRNRWTLAEPVDSAAVRLDWQRDAFSGGVQGYYREPVQFLNRNETNGLTTFDVYFSWRTPWNASLSVGASNLLNYGVDESKPRDNSIKDPFEAVYGRIPYVRYKQDL